MTEEDVWKELMGHKRRRWGFQWYIRDDDGQIDVCLHISCLSVEEETLLLYQPIIGGNTARTGLSDPNSENDGNLKLLLRNEDLDRALSILYHMVKKTRLVELESYVTKALNTRDKVHAGNSYPFYHPKAAKGK